MPGVSEEYKHSLEKMKKENEMEMYYMDDYIHV